MYDLPAPSDRQIQILKYCFRIEHLLHEWKKRNQELEKLLVFTFRYGYANIAMGNLPPEMTKQGRHWIKVAHQICRSEGFDTESMYAPEIANTLIAISRTRAERIYKPYYRARQKLIQTALDAQVSALKSEIHLIGNEFVYTIGYHYSRGLLFTQNDKQTLCDLKQHTIDSLIRAIWKLGDARWLKGDCPERSSREAFIGDAKLATWIGIDEVRIGYYQSDRLKSGQVIKCNETPKKDDDIRMLDIRIALYYDFEQSPEDGSPTSRISYFVISETLLD